MLVNFRVISRSASNKGFKPKFPNADSIEQYWKTITTPAVDICQDISGKSPWLRQKLYVPFGNGLANVEQQISAFMEKDPYTKKMAKEQKIYLTDRSAIEKSAGIFGQLLTFLIIYQITFGILALIYSANDYDDGTSAGQMAQNEMLEMHRDIAGLRQELKILHMERNKFNIEIQKCQMEITQLKEKNKKMNKSLEAQTDTINLIKRQVLME